MSKKKKDAELPDIEPAGAGPSAGPPYDNNPESEAPPHMDCPEVRRHPLDVLIDPENGQQRDDFPVQVTPGGTYEV